ncbi:actin associated Wsp1 protein [Rutstroemia sp. NJR-2017a BBW]|nr:actin associated Wsp1 protein [Rutstroemia sp. NJR-2017a BBW]
MSEYSIPTPKLKYHCNHDDRFRIITLFYQAGFTKDQIAIKLNLSIRQIEYALQHQLTLQKRCSGRPFLGPSERQKLVVWIQALYSFKKPDLIPQHAAVRLTWALEQDPIKTLWDIIKDYIAQWYPQVYSSHYGLKEAVLGGWDNITKSKFEN